MLREREYSIIISDLTRNEQAQHSKPYKDAGFGPREVLGRDITSKKVPLQTTTKITKWNVIRSSPI